jgi:hypothetical protein
MGENTNRALIALAAGIAVAAGVYTGVIDISFISTLFGTAK